MKAKSTLPAEESPSVASPRAGRSVLVIIAILIFGLLALGSAALLYRRHAAHRAAIAAQSKLAAENAPAKSRPAATPAYESKLQDRTITNEQKARFVRALHGAPRGKVTVAAFQGDRETYLYATKIASMLSDAGYASGDPPVSLLPATETPQTPQVLLFVSSQVPIHPHALAIKNAFDLIGIRCEFSYRETPGHPGDLQIGVYPAP